MVFVYVIYFIFGFLITLIALVYWKLIRPQKQLHDAFRAQGIPGEPYVPLLGQLLDMNRASKNDRALEYFEELPKKHGYYFLFGFGPLTRLILLDPELISDFLSRAKAVHYHKPIDLMNIVKPVAGAHNLLVSEDDEHDRARKMLNPAFHFTNLRAMVSIMADESAKVIDEILNTPTSTNRINVERFTSLLTFSIIASSAFGQSFGDSPEEKKAMCARFGEVKDLVMYRTYRMINQIKFLSELPFWGKKTFDEVVGQVRKFVEQSIAKRRSGKSRSSCPGSDLLDLLLDAVDDRGEPFAEEQIRDEAIIFVIAGHETTSTLLIWTLYVLMTKVDVLQACRDEVDRVLPNKTALTFEHLNELVVIESVLQETLRLYSPAPFFARRCIREHTLNSPDGKIQLHIPVGTNIVVQTHVLHRLEKYWPRPLEFDYKRWMRNPETGLKPKLSHSHAFLPFAAGPRDCIGRNFALLEAKVILAMLVQRCNFELEPGQKIVRDINGITIGMKYGMFAKVSDRYNESPTTL